MKSQCCLLHNRVIVDYIGSHTRQAFLMRIIVRHVAGLKKNGHLAHLSKLGSIAIYSANSVMWRHHRVEGFPDRNQRPGWMLLPMESTATCPWERRVGGYCLWCDLERLAPPYLLAQDTLLINEFLSQPWYVEGAGQVLSCARIIRPNPVTGLRTATMMMIIISLRIYFYSNSQLYISMR